MFVRARPEDIDQPWAVVTKTGPGDFHRQALDRQFIISQNLCSPKLSEQACFEKLEKARSAGTHLLMDDFEGGSSEQKLGSYFIELAVPGVVNCNPVLVSSLCD